MKPPGLILVPNFAFTYPSQIMIKKLYRLWLRTQFAVAAFRGYDVSDERSPLPLRNINRMIYDDRHLDTIDKAVKSFETGLRRKGVAVLEKTVICG